MASIFCFSTFTCNLLNSFDREGIFYYNAYEEWSKKEPYNLYSVKHHTMFIMREFTCCVLCITIWACMIILALLDKILNSFVFLYGF